MYVIKVRSHLSTTRKHSTPLIEKQPVGQLLLKKIAIRYMYV